MAVFHAGRARLFALAQGVKPGDVVALESPTYYGFLDILENLGLRALEIPTHPRHGLSVDALQLALDTQPVKALLLVPTRITAPRCRSTCWARKISPPRSPMSMLPLLSC